MTKNLFWQLLTVVAVLLPVAYQFYVWPSLPAQVPTHFGFNGQADDYTSRDHLWLLTLALPLGVALLMAALPRFDPKHRLDSNNVNYQKLRLTLVALVGGLSILCLYTACHPGTAPVRPIAVLVGLAFALMGNYLTTVQPNYFVGIRTPWTLENSVVWTQTHRVGGMVFCVAGLLLAALALVLPLAWVETAILVVALGSAVFSYGYSYWLFRRHEAVNRVA